MASRWPVRAHVTLIAGWTGLQWGELRVLRVAEVQEVSPPVLWVALADREWKVRSRRDGWLDGYP